MNKVLIVAELLSELGIRGNYLAGCFPQRVILLRFRKGSEIDSCFRTLDGLCKTQGETLSLVIVSEAVLEIARNWRELRSIRASTSRCAVTPFERGYCPPVAVYEGERLWRLYPQTLICNDKRKLRCDAERRLRHLKL